MNRIASGMIIGFGLWCTLLVLMMEVRRAIHDAVTPGQVYDVGPWIEFAVLLAIAIAILIAGKFSEYRDR